MQKIFCLKVKANTQSHDKYPKYLIDGVQYHFYFLEVTNYVLNNIFVIENESDIRKYTDLKIVASSNIDDKFPLIDELFFNHVCEYYSESGITPTCEFDSDGQLIISESCLPF